MDLFAGLFGLGLIMISVVLAYHWGVKPDREEKKRRVRMELAEARRKQSERSRNRPAL